MMYDSIGMELRLPAVGAVTFVGVWVVVATVVVGVFLNNDISGDLFPFLTSGVIVCWGCVVPMGLESYGEVTISRGPSRWRPCESTTCELALDADSWAAKKLGDRLL